jgi:hypothetical protein
MADSVSGLDSSIFIVADTRDNLPAVLAEFYTLPCA